MMVLPKSISTRENQSYCETVDEKVAVRVCLANGEGETIVSVQTPNLVSTTQTVYNKSITVANQIESQVLVDDTKQYLIRHRDRGTIEFGFDAALSTFMTIPKGASFESSSMLLTGKTLYFRSEKLGTIEILEYS